MSYWTPPDGVMVMEATGAVLKDVQQGILHVRFKALVAGRVVIAARTSVDKFFLAWIDEGKGGVVSYHDVPAAIWQLIYNRLRPVSDAVISVPLSTYVQQQLDIGKVVPFNSVKRGTLRSYISKGTFPDSRGLVEDEKGKLREACIVGAPKINDRGVLSIMTDRSIIFYPI